LFTSVTTKSHKSQTAGRVWQEARQKLAKTAGAYAAVAAGCIAFSRIYSLLGHGAHSAAMIRAYLYPLLGGVLPFILICLLAPQFVLPRHFRLCYNAYHSGLAALLAGSLLQGVYEIAGTGSPGTTILKAGGMLLLLLSILYYLYNLYRRRLYLDRRGQTIKIKRTGWWHDENKRLYDQIEK
jgi:hypothetical protein